MTRTRPTWPDLPAHVRDAVVAELGGLVTGWTSHDGGYSPGWALTLKSAGGSLFLKVASTEYDVAARLHRKEAVRAAALPDVSRRPRSAGSRSCPGGAEPAWVVIASDVVDGRVPRTEPWDLDDLDRLQHLARRIAEVASPERQAEACIPWLRERLRDAG